MVTTALELPVGLLHRQAWPLFLLLVPLLSLSWGAGSLFTWAVGGMAPLEAALAGACITSTDPVLVHAVVKGKQDAMCAYAPLNKICVLFNVCPSVLSCLGA